MVAAGISVLRLSASKMVLALTIRSVIVINAKYLKQPDISALRMVSGIAAQMRQFKSFAE